MPTKVDFKEALSLLLKGKLVALPTETVYGLAGRIDKKETLEKIFLLKKRPFFDPLIVHCYNTKQALKYVSSDTDFIENLFLFFSPGPLTVIANKNKKISSLITAGKKTVALRIPQHPLMRKVLKNLPVPLAIPSANLYGKVSPIKAEHVLSSFNNTVPVLDGGSCKNGLESTIIFPDMKKQKLFILRPGIITKENLETFLKKKNLPWFVEAKQDPFQPGGQNSHYQPDSPLYILETEQKEQELRKFLLEKFPRYNLKQLVLDPSAQKTAHKLYSQLRQLSNKKNTLIFVKKTKEQTDNLWEAIWNRLNKASSGYYKF